MYHGLTSRDVHTIREILDNYPDVETVYLFGSRAMGTYRKGSDIDLVIMNEGVSADTLRSILFDM